MNRLLFVLVAGWLGEASVSAQALNIPRFYTAESDGLYTKLTGIVAFGFRNSAITCLRMNNRGDFYGRVWEEPFFDHFARLNGTYISLNSVFFRDVDSPTSPCAGLASLNAINESGDIVGTCRGKWVVWPWTANTRIVLVRNGTMTDLGVPDEPEFGGAAGYFKFGQSGALRLNNSDQVLVGEPNSGGSWVNDLKTGKWTRLAAGTDWVARDINDKGEVVGQFTSTRKGGIWFNGSLREIPNNPGTEPNSINSPAYIAKEGRVFWTSGHITDQDGNILARLPPADQTVFSNSTIQDGCKLTAQSILRYGGYLWRDGDLAGWGNNGNPDAMYFPPMKDHSGSLYFTDIDDSGRLLSAWLGVMNPSAPLIVDQPRTIRVREGQPADFSVTVAGASYGPITPTLIMNGGWKLNSGLAEGEVTVRSSDMVLLTNRLHIVAASLRHAGDYYFVATNVSGVVTSAVARLELIVPPSIKQEPVATAACPGSAVRFAVEATGVPAPTYQWRLDEVDLPGETGATLTLNNVGPEAEGSYSVVVENSEGSLPSAPALLSVLATPSVQGVSPAQSVAADAKVSLEVTATGSAPLAFQWRHNGELLPDIVGPALSIEKADKADSGEYSVRVVNACGAVTSATMVLTVLPPPPRLLNPRLFMGFEVAGEVGRTYRVETRPDADSQEWTVLTRLTLATSPQLFLDMDSPSNPRRIYRAVAEP